MLNWCDLLEGSQHSVKLQFSFSCKVMKENEFEKCPETAGHLKPLRYAVTICIKQTYLFQWISFYDPNRFLPRSIEVLTSIEEFEVKFGQYILLYN